MNQEFFGEIKLQLQRDNEIIENIKKRSTHLVSFIGVIFAALIGFLGLILTKDDSLLSNVLFNFNALTFIIPMLCVSLISMTVCFWIINAKDRLTPIVSDGLLCKCGIKYELNEKNYRDWTKRSSEEYYEAMGKAYLRCIRECEVTIESIAIRFNLALWTFGIGMCVTIALLLFFVFI